MSPSSFRSPKKPPAQNKTKKQKQFMADSGFNRYHEHHSEMFSCVTAQCTVISGSLLRRCSLLTPLWATLLAVTRTTYQAFTLISTSTSTTPAATSRTSAFVSISSWTSTSTSTVTTFSSIFTSTSTATSTSTPTPIPTASASAASAWSSTPNQNKVSSG